MHLELGWQLASSGDPPVSAFHSTGVRYRRPCLAFYMGSRDLNSGIHTCVLGFFYPLNCHPSPLPHFEFMLCMIIWLVLCIFTEHLLLIVWENPRSSCKKASELSIVQKIDIEDRYRFIFFFKILLSNHSQPQFPSLISSQPFPSTFPLLQIHFIFCFPLGKGRSPRDTNQAWHISLK